MGEKELLVCAARRKRETVGGLNFEARGLNNEAGVRV
jgi:hypothetical protein